MATLETDELLVCIEIHYDALTNDRPESITFKNLHSPVEEFIVDGQTFKTLGHTDTLKHLCYHACEPADNFKLIMAVDIIGHAVKHYESIDWAHLHKNHPVVVNLITLLHYLTPLPGKLSDFRPDRHAVAPSGVGKCILPLSQILIRRHTIKRVFSDLYYPSNWWLRAAYGIRPGKPLFWCRWITHSLRILRSLMRRFIASVRSK